MSKPKPDFATVIKKNILSVKKYSRNINPSSKCNTNQGRITFKLDINKPPPLNLCVYL